ncbi:kinase-like domain-containing protein [Fomes fomentarius]|nr:kinase-like domain-containing protein [Fomes fomentarius]
MQGTNRLPSYAYLSPEGVQGYARITEEGAYSLLPAEIEWRDRYIALESRGYLLRRRYHPDWSPSWTGTNLDPTYCEDSVIIHFPHVIDATRVRDNFRVSLKVTEKDNVEIAISRFLSSIQRPDNHCIPLLEVFSDPVDPKSVIMVTPYLRPMNDPPFGALGEVLDFIDQTVTGLIFLHEHFIAHRDIAPPNIMMDGRPLYPQGHHPVRLEYTSDNVYDATPLPRIDNPVRYFYIDFGISHRFKEESKPMLLGRKGRNQQVPELSSTVPYDAYKVDVYALGDVYAKELVGKYYGLDKLQPLVDAMKRPNPSERVSAKDALAKFRDIRAKDLSGISGYLRWRLRPRDESIPETVVYSAHHLYKTVASAFGSNRPAM